MSTEHLPVVFLLSCTPIPMKPHSSTGRSSLAPSSHACCLAACALRSCCLGPRMPQRSLSYPPNACLVENPKTLESKFHARALVALGVWQAVGVWHKLPVGGAGHTHAQERSHQAASRGWMRTRHARVLVHTQGAAVAPFKTADATLDVRTARPPTCMSTLQKSPSSAASSRSWNSALSAGRQM